MMRAVSVEPVNATPPTRGSATARRADDRTVARQEMQHVGRHAACKHQPDRLRRNERRLLGRFREHCVAGRQCRRNLAREYRQRKIPRADAREHATTVQAQLVAFARGPGQAHRRAEFLPARAA